MSYLYRMFFCINVHSDNIRVGCISNTTFALPLYFATLRYFYNEKEVPKVLFLCEC